MRKSSWLGLLVVLGLCLVGTPLLAQPVVNECGGSGTELPAGPSTTETTIEVSDDDVTEIGMAEIGMNISTTWTGYCNPSVDSPSGTTVVLNLGYGSHTSNFNCIFSDLGADNSTFVPTPTGTDAPSLWDCGGCRIQTPANSATTMADFIGEDPNGEWELTVTMVSSTGGTAELNEWCVIIWAVAPVTGLTCVQNLEDDEETEDVDESVGHVAVTFTAGADYDTIEVRNYNVDVIGEFVDEYITDTEYTVIVGPLGAPQLADLTVVGIIGEDNSAPAPCGVSLRAEPLECLTGSEGDIPNGGPIYLDVVEFTDEVDISDVTVDVDITYPWQGELEINIAHPDNTVVQLHNRFGSSTADIVVLYWELGAPANSLPLNEGNIMQPSGPGALSDFVGGTTHNDEGLGAWALAVSGAVSFGPGTVNSWELCVYDSSPAFAPTGMACEEGDELGTVTASALAGADYTRVRWFVNGEVAEDLDYDPPLEAGVSGFVFTTEAQPLPSLVTLQVQGFTGVDEDQVPGPLVRCSQRVSLPGVGGVACSQVEGDVEIEVSWINPTETVEYDFIEIWVDGELVETLDDGTLTTYTTDLGFEENTVVEVEVRGGLDDPPAVADAGECIVLVLGPMDVDQCASDEADPPVIARGVGTSTSDITVLELGTVLEAEIIMGGDAAFFGNIDQFLDHVDTGTSLTIHTTLGPSAENDYFMRWADDGVVYAFASDLDGGLSFLPQGGSFADAFGGDTSDGTWTLTCTDPTFAYSVNDWCLRMNICETLPPTDFVVEAVDADVFMTWVNDAGSDYTEVRVYQGEDLIDTLDADEEEYEVLGLDDGRYQFSVAGYSDVTDCEARTQNGFAGVGFIETCIIDTEVPASGGGTSVSTITVFESVVIADVEIVIDFEVGFTSDYTIAAISPFGTTVTLHSRVGSGTDDFFQLVWSNRDASDPRGNGIPFACDFCIMNPSPGSLDDFQGELSDGPWDFEFTGFGPADMPLLCVDVYEGCPGVPPSDLLAEVDESDIILSWLNNPTDDIEYNSLTILRNDEILVEDLDAETEEYLDARPLSGFYTYKVIAVVTDPETSEDCVAGSAPSERVAKGIQLDCMESDSEDIGVPAAVTIELEVFDDPTPDDVQVVIDITFGFIPYLDIFITNPDGDEVKLFTGLGLVPGDADYADINCVFADSGEDQPAFDYDVGATIAPSGPGALEDFLDASPVGVWELDVTASFSTLGSLNEFCIQLLVGCPLDRPSLDTCTILNGNALPPIEITWSGVDAEIVDEIQILRNDVEIATVDADVTDYLDADIAGTGRQRYRIVAFDDELECGKPSNECESEALGRFTQCDESGTVLTAGLLTATLMEFTYEAKDGTRPGFEEPEDGFIGELEVDVDIETAWAGDNDIWLMSPDFTIVTLNSTLGSDTPDIKVTYSDEGSSFLSPANTTCECLIKPQGPGEMADFAGQDPEGTWLMLNTFVSFGPSTLSEWCLGVFPDRLPPPDGGSIEFVRGDVDNNGSVSAIPDGLRVLNWGSGNANEPPCMAAADVDGNGTVSAIPDGLRILNWGSGNALPPPAPFPDCGEDPDDPTLEDGPPCDTDGDGENDGGNTCDGDPTP